MKTSMAAGVVAEVVAGEVVEELDVAVLQYQNQKLFQELEAQKVEYILCEDKYNKLKKQQETYEGIVAVVNNSWEQLVTDLESCSISTNESANTRHDLQGSQKLRDGAFIPIQDDFLSKLFETGATECCSYSGSAGQIKSHTQLTSETTKNILQNIVSSINWTWHVREDAASSLEATCSEAGAQLQKSVNDHRMEVRSLVLGVNDLHLKHRLLTNSTYNLRDMDAVFKADQKCLAGELATAMSELEESNSKLASVKAQSDGSNVAPIFYSKLGNKQSAIDVARNEKEIQDMEAFLKEIQVLVTSRMEEIGNLQERRTENLKKLVNLQNVLVDIKSVSSSGVFLMLKEQLDKSKMEMNQFRISLKKLQVEKDNFLWHEKEVNMEANVAVISGKICEFSKSRIAELEEELPKFIQDRIAMETKVEETLRELGRKEIIAGFKEHVSSLPKEMVAMQSELEKLKDSSSEIHCLRAQVQFLSAILQREVDKLQSMFDKSAGQLHEIKNLHLVVVDLRESEQELKLFLDMYRRESTDSWDIMESRGMEYKALAHVQSLKSSLDEHNLDSRVKVAIEVEGRTQKRLATAEAKIADLRQNLELSLRQIVKSSENLTSKHEEGLVYLSEIESIGQAYEDLRTQNQQLLQEITERDEYNIKLLMEGVKARQLHDVVYREVGTMDEKLQEADLLMHLYGLKALRFDEELKVCSDQVAKLADEGRQNSISLGNAQRILSDVCTESHKLRNSLNEMQVQVERSRLEVTDILIELERERFNKRTIDEGLAVMKIKATSLRSQTEGSVVLEELQQEKNEYRGILKCYICHERQKEVVITKCYHLFCSQCIRRVAESRHRKCPICSASFGRNDIKSVYL
ncbi:hypothetical protein KFK09_008121 [Dendrobium nobile]|uniref:E3 ubiquitin protein ligase n=1 Tax=Dendrobium nobile TaxID=94219 RepID=A0A8T3BYT7_DENNO|nr:hypothetical protein KFK09_008121 [Dendrobium nobile]